MAAKQQPAMDKPAHTPGTDRGEEQVSDKGREPGRHHSGHTGSRRPAGHSTPRDVTGINPDKMEPIDPRSPYLPPA
ncbi:MAG TPA: hypothetical protein VNQ79_04035 [Blastocatellia bacterium]|nr:hypothetical protein [Blastocatellia bacterium]